MQQYYYNKTFMNKILILQITNVQNVTSIQICQTKNSTIHATL